MFICVCVPRVLKKDTHAYCSPSCHILNWMDGNLQCLAKYPNDRTCHLPCGDMACWLHSLRQMRERERERERVSLEVGGFPLVLYIGVHICLATLSGENCLTSL